MCDPLSLTTGVLSILSACGKIGWELKTFRDSVNFVDETVNGLIQDVSSLANVLESMKNTLKHTKDLRPTSQTGHIGAHYQNLAEALKNGNSSLTKLGGALQKINKDASFLEGTRKTIRLQAAASQITVYRTQIQGSRDVLSLSMQIILL